MRLQSLLPPSEVSVLAGASGAGKSTLILQFLHAWLQGKSFLEVAPPAEDIAYLVGDRSINSLRHRSTDVGLDIDILPHASLVDDESIDLNKFKQDPLGLLCTLLDKLKGPLFIVDPLIVFLGVDLNRYNLVAPQLIRLNRFCRARGYTVLGTHHTTKARTDFAFLRPQDRISGSSALSAFTSTQLALTSPDEVQHSIPLLEQAARLDVISHLAAPETHWLSRDSEGLFTPMGAEAEHILSACGPAGLAVYQAIAPMADGLTQTSEIVESLSGMTSRATVFRQLDKLLAAGLITRHEQGLYSRAPVH
jgi:RecA-family ATPase